tara:strand:+ start:221 stop:502 length:282 start_codon:yes stop_codon:yes gene_type:complete
MGFEKKWCEFECSQVERETEKALLCTIQGKDVWIPKSQLSKESEVSSEGESGIITISEWIAGEKGLEVVEIKEQPKPKTEAKPDIPAIDDIPF